MKRKSTVRRGGRSQRGAVLGLIYVLGLFAIICLFSFGYDTAHNILVRSQLQAAADAAAIAGAYDLSLSGGTGVPTPSPSVAQSYALIATDDALAACTQNTVDGSQIQSVNVQTYPCQFGAPATTPSSGYSGSYYMTVTVTRRMVNLMSTLFGHGSDTIYVVSVAGPIGSPTVATSATAPFPFAIYAPNQANGTHNWFQQAGLTTLDVGILPLLTNGSTGQFVSGPTGLLGGVLAVAGAGGNGAPTMSMMEYFDPAQNSFIGPPSLSVGQTILLMNPGLTGLNLSLFPSGPLTVENYFQTGLTKPGFLGLLAPGPSTIPSIAPFLQGKTFIVPVVTNPNASILAMPLASILQGGVGAQITGFVPVQFVSSAAQPGTGLSLLGVVVLPPTFIVTGSPSASNSASAAPVNIGLAL